MRALKRFSATPVPLLCLLALAQISSALGTGARGRSGADRETGVSGRQLAPAPEPATAAIPALPRQFNLPLPLFSADSAWNQRADGAAVLAASDQQILVTYRVLRGDASMIHPPGPPSTTWPFMDVNYDEYSFPIFGVGSGEQSVTICDYEGELSWPGPKWPENQEGGPISIPAPAGTVRPASPRSTESDGHLVLYDTAGFTSYELWQATTVRDGSCRSRGGGRTGSRIFEAGAADYFDVRGPGTNPEGVSSARAHGTPLLAGLILPEDVENGAIEHALAFAIPGPRNRSSDPFEPLPSDVFYPASTTETDYFNTDPNALAAGQRIRLKTSLVGEEGDPINESDLAPITRMFLAALRTYGAYLTDNAGGFTFYAEDIHTADLALDDDEVNELIGWPPGTPLAAAQTRWQAVIEKLNDDLGLVPIAFGPWLDGQDPATASITVANFEVVEPARSDGGEENEPCTAGPTTLCLNGGRFAVEIVWEDFAGASGPGEVVPFGSDDSGLFWFFDSDNWEMLVKVLDGCAINNNFWVFFAATTDVGYTLRVTDTATGTVKEYVNPIGRAAPAITDTSAFATCP